MKILTQCLPAHISSAATTRRISPTQADTASLEPVRTVLQSLDNVMAGTMLRVAKEEPEDGWYRVIVRGDVAYVYADFLYVSQWESGTEFTRGTVTKDVDEVELRSAASATADVIATAGRYQQFVVLEENVDDKWYRVDYKGADAYLPLGALALENVCIDDVLW